MTSVCRRLSCSSRYLSKSAAVRIAHDGSLVASLTFLTVAVLQRLADHNLAFPRMVGVGGVNIIDAVVQTE